MEALNQSDVPQVAFELLYNNKTMTADVAPFVLSISYTDYASGQADELDIELENTDGRWLNDWYPDKGAALTLSIGYAGKPLTNAGSFCIDEISPSGTPAVVRMRSTATGVMGAVRTRQARSFENTSLPAIVQTIAKRHNMTVIGKIESFKIDRATQYHESDIGFLARLARQYGYAFKVTDNNKKLVFWKQSDLLTAPATRTFKPEQLKNWSGTDRITDAPGEVRVRHHDPKTKTLVVYGLVGEKSTIVGQTTTTAKKRGHGSEQNADTVKLAQRAPTQEQAKVMTQAELDRRHLERTSIDLELEGDANLCAGAVIALTDFGRLSGTYTISRARHHISRSDGFRTDLECKRVTPEVKGKVQVGTKAKAGGLKVYGIQNGKTEVVGTTEAPKKGRH